MADSRRVLMFDRLDDAVADAEHLLNVGYRNLGNWNLGQTLAHLTHWLTFPVDGFPRQGMFFSSVLWIVRHTVGKSMIRKVLESGVMPEGSQTIPTTVAPPNTDDRAAFEAFVKAVQRFREHRGEYHPSALFGPLDRQKADKLQRIHCQHHLSFLIPGDQTMEWTRKD